MIFARFSAGSSYSRTDRIDAFSEKEWPLRFSPAPADKWVGARSTLTLIKAAYDW